MDPISAIFVMTVLTGLFVKGVDVATDGLLSAEVGGGVRGAFGYAGRAGRARWRLANTKAREIRMASPQGRKVQELIDLAGMFGRVAFGEAVRFGSGARSAWRTGREQARSARMKRRGEVPWPVTEWLQTRLVRLRETRTKTPNGANEPAPNEPNGASSGPEPEPNTTTETDPNGGCLEVLVWAERDEGGRHPFLTCGQPCEPGWRICPEHKAERFADPNYPNTDIDEWRTGPGDSWPDAYRHVPNPNGDPNGDPNMPLESTVPNQNGDVRCGCCAQLHAPLAPGEHCPNCHIHEPAPNQSAAAGTTRGTTMTDITTAPQAITAVQAVADKFESIHSKIAALLAEVESLRNAAEALADDSLTLAEGMGDFATGFERDAASSVGEMANTAIGIHERVDAFDASVTAAKEAVDGWAAALHEEFDSSIEAAAGKGADAHAAMQEG